MRFISLDMSDNSLPTHNCSFLRMLAITLLTIGLLAGHTLSGMHDRHA